ncbi:MAG TPA: universal stress protein [Acidimicrobiales bacterium]
MGEIIVGMDGSAGAAAALRWAVRESNLRGWPVRAVHAGGAHDLAPEDQGVDAATQEAAEKALAAAVDSALGDDASEHIAVEVVDDRPATVLLERAIGAHLLVVGARGAGGFPHLHLGSVSTRVLHGPPCPVAVVRGDERRRTDGRIVVGVDGSAPAQRALRWALVEAKLRACAVEVLHVWQVPVAGGFYAVALDPALAEADARRGLDAALAAEDTSGVPLTGRTPCGGVADHLLRAAENADLVVVGSTGKGAVRRFLLGSVSQQVAHHAPCPVVVVP